MLRHFNGNQKIYKLSLDDGITWGCCAAEGIAHWLERMAYLMQLKRGSIEEVSKIFMFLPYKSDNLPNYPGIENDEWNIQFKEKDVRCFLHEDAFINFIELSESFVNNTEMNILTMISFIDHIYTLYKGVSTAHKHI